MEAFVFHRHDPDVEDQNFNWFRVIGIAFVIALHVVVVLLLLIPASAPKIQEEKQRTKVAFIKIPPPPPPPPPVQQPKLEPLPQPPKPTPPKPTPPKPKPKPKLPPPVVTPPKPRTTDVVSTPPSPPPVATTTAPTPAPVVPRVVSTDASVDVTSKEINKPIYPPSAIRLGATGTVVLDIEVDEEGNAVDVTVEKSSHNHDLDRSAMQAARRWKFNPKVVNGHKVRGHVRVPVDFKL